MCIPFLLAPIYACESVIPDMEMRLVKYKKVHVNWGCTKVQKWEYGHYDLNNVWVYVLSKDDDNTAVPLNKCEVQFPVNEVLKLPV